MTDPAQVPVVATVRSHGRPGDGPDAATLQARPATRAVVLAAGRGTRMRAAGDGDDLDEEQRRLAAQGLKALLPFHGHAYLSYALSALADGGMTRVCIVVGPGADPIREHYARRQTRRLRLTFAVQAEPRGSADALLAAEDAVGDEPFVLVNGDNIYPAAVVDRVRRLPGPGLAGFVRDGLIEGGIPSERLASFAVIETDARGCMARIIEKPGAALLASAPASALVSMTCWRFEPSIIAACRAIGPSARGEHEIPDAVTLLVRAGACFQVVPVHEAVLDLTSRADVRTVGDRLRGAGVAL